MVRCSFKSRGLFKTNSKFYQQFCCILYITLVQYLCLSVQATVETTTTADNGDPSSSIDTPVTLEGQCVVVCDAAAMKTGEQYQQLSSRSVGLTKKVAFSVMRKINVGFTNGQFDEADRAVITFDYIMLNIGNGFDTMSSAFVTKVNGVYSFSFTIFKLYNRNSLTISLTVNGNPTFSAFADGNQADHEVAQNGGLIRLQSGDRVKLEVLEGHLNGGWQDSTFSGYLLYQDYL